MIRVTPTISIDEREIQEEFVKSSGPGGQNVNKVSTAVQLRFCVAASASLPEEVRERLLRIGGRRVTTDGILVIEARRFRSQHRNREDAIRRLVHLVRKAAEKPTARRKTRPTRASKEARLDSKRHHAEIKRRRRPVLTKEF